MKKYYMCFLIVISVFVYRGCATKCSNDDLSYLEVIERRYDFGKVTKGQMTSVPFSFQLKNVSDTNVIIKEVEASCNCINVQYYLDTLQPGGTTEINGIVDITNQVGQFSKPIFVNLDNDIIMLRIIGNIIE